MRAAARAHIQRTRNSIHHGNAVRLIGESRLKNDRNFRVPHLLIFFSFFFSLLYLSSDSELGETGIDLICTCSDIVRREMGIDAFLLFRQKKLFTDVRYDVAQLFKYFTLVVGSRYMGTLLVGFAAAATTTLFFVRRRLAQTVLSCALMFRICSNQFSKYLFSAAFISTLRRPTEI